MVMTSEMHDNFTTDYATYLLMCLDINECSTGRHSCDLNSTCVNLPGTYSCPCKTGFAVNPLGNVCEGRKLDHDGQLEQRNGIYE